MRGQALDSHDTGIQVNDLMVQYFPEVVDLSFTAHMEEDLDMIATGKCFGRMSFVNFIHPSRKM